MDEPRVYSVLDREARLVLSLTDEPGHFHLSRPPEDPSTLIECSYATLQCYDARSEAELLRLVFQIQDFEELLENLKARGYRVIEGQIQASKIARL